MLFASLGVALDLLEPLPRFLDPEFQLALKSLVGVHGTELLVKLYLAPQAVALIVHIRANNIATVRSSLLVLVAQTGAVVRGVYVVTSCCCIKKTERRSAIRHVRWQMGVSVDGFWVACHRRAIPDGQTHHARR